MAPSVTRTEYEYSIPVVEARELLDTLRLRSIIEKNRYHIEESRHIWKIDVFKGINKGLIVAEIELHSVDEKFQRPGWLGKEVSNDP